MSTCSCHYIVRLVRDNCKSSRFLSFLENQKGGGVICNVQYHPKNAAHNTTSPTIRHPRLKNTRIIPDFMNFLYCTQQCREHTRLGQ